ncbi:MAG: hypothetical protein H5T76_26035 [Streptomyces sp.]|nr:hypothetical protein [Streptomyces sp.]
MSVRLIRAVLLDPLSGTVTVDEHVRVRLPARRPWPQLGDVLIERGTGTRTAAGHPGALVVAAHLGPRCRLLLGRDRTVLDLRTDARGPAEGVGDGDWDDVCEGVREGAWDDIWERVASLAHAWLVAGLPAAEFARTPLSVPGGQPPVSPGSSRWSACRAARASSVDDLPTDAYSSRACR